MMQPICLSVTYFEDAFFHGTFFNDDWKISNLKNKQPSKVVNRLKTFEQKCTISDGSIFIAILSKLTRTQLQAACRMQKLQIKAFLC